MDALKRAETSKQEATRNPSGSLPASSEFIRLEPLAVEPAKNAASPLHNLAAHLDTVDVDLAAAAPSAPRPASPQTKASPPAKPAESQEAVRNAFAAKQTVEAPSRLPLWLALGTLGFAGIAIGGYV